MRIIKFRGGSFFACSLCWRRLFFFVLDDYYLITEGNGIDFPNDDLIG